MLRSQETSWVKLKVTSEAKAAEQTRLEQRKKNVLILALDFLQSHGYHHTVTQLESESHVSLKQWATADNMDLMSIVQEFESYYNIKFQKQPKLTRKLQDKEDGSVEENTKKSSAGSTVQRKVLVKQSSSTLKDPELPHYTEEGKLKMNALNKTHSHKVLPSISPQQSMETIPVESIRKNPPKESITDVNIVGQSCNNTKLKRDNVPVAPPSHFHSQHPIYDVLQAPIPQDDLYENRLLKPMPGWGNNAEMKELAAIISRDIFLKNPNVRWSDIAGLATSKRLVKEAVVFPMKYPELFTGILTPWKGLLLYGPPGTGKTMLAKAVATECNTTFFNISASSIVSKWRGDSEKLVRVLFELARYHAPSTIFLDELESIMGHRASEGTQEHEGSRRMKTELLIQMDGLAKTNDHVFLLAASNLPWELDIAMLRRLEKRILIGLPDEEARRAMFEHNLPADLLDGYGKRVISETGLDYQQLAEKTHGYSGSDINLVCKEAAMRPLRKIFEYLDCENPSKEKIEREPVTQLDVEAAIESTRPSCDLSLEAKYLDWQDSFGSV